MAFDPLPLSFRNLYCNFFAMSEKKPLKGPKSAVNFFGTFPKTHPFWYPDPSLNQNLGLFEYLAFDLGQPGV